MSYYGVAPAPPRAASLWPEVVSRLETAAMEEILGGPDRVVLNRDADAEGLGGESSWWARCVIIPVVRNWEVEDVPGREIIVPWLVRAEAHSPGGDYDPLVTLEATHGEAFARLHGWRPGAIGGANARLRAWRETAPQPAPQHDAPRDVWQSSSEFRILLEPVIA